MIYLFVCVQTCACVCICTRECSWVCRCAGVHVCRFPCLFIHRGQKCSLAFLELELQRLAGCQACHVTACHVTAGLHSRPRDESHLSSPYTYPLHLKVVLPLYCHTLLMISFLPLKLTSPFEAAQGLRPDVHVTQN